MNLRSASLCALLLLFGSLSSCGTVRRAGKDLSIAVLSPAVVLYGAATDSIGTAQEAREALGGGPVMETITIPFAFLWRGFVHTIYCTVHAADFFLFPVYGLAELHPYGPEIEPLDFYTGTWFDRDEKAESGTDPQSGEDGLGLVR